MDDVALETDEKVTTDSNETYSLLEESNAPSPSIIPELVENDMVKQVVPDAAESEIKGVYVEAV